MSHRRPSICIGLPNPWLFDHPRPYPAVVLYCGCQKLTRRVCLLWKDRKGDHNFHRRTHLHVWVAPKSLFRLNRVSPLSMINRNRPKGDQICCWRSYLYSSTVLPSSDRNRRTVSPPKPPRFVFFVYAWWY